MQNPSNHILTIDMLQPLDLETMRYIDDIDDGEDALDELCIFAHRFIGNDMVINFKSYDHHNEPREMALLHLGTDGKWIVKDRVSQWSRTKYKSCVDSNEEDMYSKYFDLLYR